MRLTGIMIFGSLLIVLASTLLSGQAIAALNQPAQVIGMPFISTDYAIYTMPASFGGFVCIEYNSTSLVRRDVERLGIDFPLFTDAQGAKTALGPTEAAASFDGAGLASGSTANVLPFGPVDLAFPSIRQTVDQSVDYTATYFFTDTLGIGA